MPETLFQHAAVAHVGDVRIENLDMTFRVSKTLKREPNQLDLTIFNMNEKSRARCEKKGEKILLLAGYRGGEVSQIFAGDVRSGTSKLVGSDWQTTIKSGDGEKAYKFGHASGAFPPGAKLTDVLKGALTNLGGQGNLQDFAGELDGVQFPDGYTMHGRAANEVDRLLRARGLTWSIQDGQVQLLKPTAANRNQVILLSKDTGLIGTPEKVIPENELEPGYVKAKSLLRAVYNPGVSLKLESLTESGLFRIEKVTHSGDTAGQDWTSDLELRPLS